MNKRNILLTTMSTSNYKDDYRVYYYYTKSLNEEKKYCNGISALEPGTKYFLAKYPIDEIVAIGTDKTIQQTDIKVVDNLTSSWVRENPEYSNHTISPYELYKYRIADFLRNEQAGLEEQSAEIDIVKKINPNRRKEIEEILKNAIYKELLEENIDRFLEIETKLKSLFQEAKEGFWKNVKNSIEKDIQKNFESSAEYGKYVAGKKELEQYEKDILEKENIATQYEVRRQEICGDSKLSLFEREYLLMSLKSKIKESLLGIKVHTMEKEILELQKENARLEYEIITLKNHRKDNEFAYAQYFAYKNLEQKYRLLPLKENVNSAKGIKVTFVDEQLVDSSQKASYDNINGIVNVLYGNGEDEINLYIDVQGGNRTSGYVRNAVLSILNNQDSERVHICEIVGTNFLSWALEGSEIIDETIRYKITDLVSGMNAFIRYGKADMIKSYCESMKINKNSSVGKLVDYMVGIDNAISLCNIAELVNSIKGLKEFFKEEYGTEINQVENIFQILKDGIRKDYGKLLNDVEGEEIDYLELIEWCNRKGFIQQALTLIEDKMPKVYFDKGVLSYKFIDDSKGEKEEKYIKQVNPKYEKRVENLIFYNLYDQLIENNCFEMIWLLEQKQQQVKDKKKEEREAFHKNRKQYIKKILSKNKIFIPVITRDMLFELRKQLIEEDTEKEFLNDYLKFHRMERDFIKEHDPEKEQDYKDGEVDVCDSQIIYELIGTYIRKKKRWYHSIMNCIDKREYFYQFYKKDIKLKIDFSVHPDLKSFRVQLEQLFLIHEALKRERNSSNHASEKGVRLPYKVVSRAIDIYVREAKRFLGKVNE